MELDYWQKQTTDKALFPDILWSRPEHKLGAGKLLVIGGHAQAFAAAQEAYKAASSSGAGSVRVLLPDALRKTVGVLLEHGEYAPSTPSGSFAKIALADFLSHAAWADMVLIAGDLGRNSETAALLESFVQKYKGPLILTKDSVDYFSALPKLITQREQTVLVLSLAQLQKLGMALKHETPFLLSMGMLLLVQALHGFSKQYPVTIVTKEQNSLLVAREGGVSSTKLTEDLDIWRVKTASVAATYWMQNQTKLFEAVTTSLLELSKS